MLLGELALGADVARAGSVDEVGFHNRYRTRKRLGSSQLRVHAMLYASTGAVFTRNKKLLNFSVVIPTFNRLEVLPEVLTALAEQERAPSYEVVVVDDGSTDGTGEWLEAQSFPESVVVLHQSNGGPAAARNLGVRTARGEKVAFLGDDTVPHKGWLAAHAGAHAERRGESLLAVIGYTGWHARLRLDPFLRYINEYGLQFGYALIETPEDVPFNFFYTSNLSLPRRALLEEPFDLRFPYPACLPARLRGNSAGSLKTTLE